GRFEPKIASRAGKLAGRALQQGSWLSLAVARKPPTSAGFMSLSLAQPP
ncbi:hypothetical protein A2U01_0108389, partial [Trifolium medium]|nr:hypothetical protein [Trifolium medium]